MRIFLFLLLLNFVSKSISVDTVIIVRDPDCNDRKSACNMDFKVSDELLCFVFNFIIYFSACFRRMVSGKRIVHAFVQKSMDCNKLQDCYRMCEHERSFRCEGFNYR